MNVKRALVKTAAGLAAATVLCTAIIGVAHTPWGRPLLKLPLLSALAQHAGCPVGEISAKDFEHVRTTRLKFDVGTDVAGGHPALGFVLGQTERADVDKWVTAEKADCKAGFVSSVLECSNVASPGAPVIERLRLQFDAQARLVSVDLFRSEGTPADMVGRFEALSSELDHSVGAATSVVGTPSVEFVRKSPFQTVVRRYSYSDYVATATLLNLGKRGVRLRETYQWLPPRSPA
jgi:hypothetical protein